MSRRALAAALAAVALMAPARALADGDPASDFLLTQPLFVPFDRPSQPQIDRLKQMIEAARKRGYEVRVAVIGSQNDLGAVPQMMGRPQPYAKFLDAELQGGYRGRLLVVMPQGYGVRNHARPDADAEKSVAALAPPADASPDTLTAAATAAVRRLAGDAGVTVPVIPLRRAATATPSGGGANWGFRLLLAGLIAVPLIAVAVILLWPTRGDEPEQP